MSKKYKLICLMPHVIGNVLVASFTLEGNTLLSNASERRYGVSFKKKNLIKLGSSFYRYLIVEVEDE